MTFSSVKGEIVNKVKEDLTGQAPKWQVKSLIASLYNMLYSKSSKASVNERFM